MITSYFVSLDEADVLSTVLTGYSVGTNTPLSSTDTVLGALSKDSRTDQCFIFY